MFVVCWLLVVVCWLLFVGCCLLVVGCCCLFIKHQPTTNKQIISLNTPFVVKRHR